MELKYRLHLLYVIEFFKIKISASRNVPYQKYIFVLFKKQLFLLFVASHDIISNKISSE